MYSLYPHIKRLFVELNSYALTVFIAERLFFTVSYSVPHMPPFLIWSTWHKMTLVIRLYMVSTYIHLYCNYLYYVCGVESVTHIVGR